MPARQRVSPPARNRAALAGSSDQLRVGFHVTIQSRYTGQCLRADQPGFKP